jgi:hypothetical protein
MTPEEKAKELISDYCRISTSNDTSIPYKIAKQCALIAVDEILKVIATLDEDSDLMFPNEYIYWEQVKSAIQNKKPTQ